MAADRLAERAPVRRGEPRKHVRKLALAIGSSYALIWLTALATAVVLLAVPSLAELARDAFKLALTPRGPGATLGDVVGLAVHNLRVTGWPLIPALLLATRVGTYARLVDLAAAVLMLGNAAMIGAALGAYRLRLLPYVPNVPVEFLGMAAGWGTWRAAYRHALRRRDVLAAAVFLSVVLLAAACLELLAVPHTQGRSL